VFAHFELPDVPDVARRTVSMVLVVGAAALVAAVSFGQPLLGLGACIGLSLGTLNFRMIGNSVARVSASGVENKRRPLALNTFGRLGIITVVTLGLMILLANVARSMAKAGPMTSVDDVVNANVVDDNIGHAPTPPAVGSGEDTGDGA
jgi:hypothetical protein